MLTFTGILCVLSLLSESLATSPTTLSLPTIMHHVSDFELKTEAGHFRYGMYWGGVPKISNVDEWYNCVEVCNSASCSDLGSITFIYQI